MIGGRIGGPMVARGWKELGFATTVHAIQQKPESGRYCYQALSPCVMKVLHKSCRVLRCYCSNASRGSLGNNYRCLGEISLVLWM